MRFEEALNWLSKHQFHGIKPGLERIREILARLKEPHLRYPTVHISGTNGKGSTAAFLESILRQHGLKTGLYTSPHLISVCERFVINGNPISEEKFAELTSKVKKALGASPATYFELTTAIAFLAFAEEEVDIAVIECGLGGRLDATNVIYPEVSIVTSISFDHEFYLGNTLSSIAFEEADIIKPQRPAVTCWQKEEAMKVIEEIAFKRNSPLYVKGKLFDAFPQNGTVLYKGKNYFSGLKPSLKGRHQLDNLSLAIKAAELLEENKHLNLKAEKLKEAIANTFWPGRFEIFEFSPPVILDGAHNEDGIRILKTALADYGIEEYALIFGASNEDKTKPFVKMLSMLLPKCRKLFICPPPGPRKPVSIEEWQEKLKGFSLPPSFFSSSWEETLEKALVSRGDLPLVVAGSLYLVGHVRAYLKTKIEKQSR
ncbi:FolC bifunctional protein [Thermodesulfatator indicus DSM 15286]|uniref:Dihydrofolate synthase/folylpolyglutamate synthase n=1 Tax=Thermodesulfatator indicus (strain DSM 15286 / JCM 11887 / CIR29812) TaxID=667014 RepID=F8ADM8_THEID|nr:folylpolyglutamate synthase/dihydrofolate synthase family protein [Thermodesulfatator indicus]AEH44912.1 FolC bifunctional protein [Thermodesulfatator indicus DSM 15286]